MRWISGYALPIVAAGFLLLLPTAGQPGQSSHPSAMHSSARPGPGASGTPVLPALHGKAAAEPAEFFVMIDPSHGGEDRGTILGKIQEKDVTLNLARELRKQLEERGIHSRLLRESDATVSLQRRAEATNEEHAAIYIALHAGGPGRGVRIYSAAFPAPAPPGPPTFIPWEFAQSGSLERSRIAARALSDELRKNDVQVTLLSAPLRPLNCLLMPAISMEWAPEADDLKPHQMAKVSAKLTSAVASAIARVEATSGARP